MFDPTTPPFPMKLMTPDGILYTGDVISMVAPGASGKLGILFQHMPLLCLLKSGTLICLDKRGAWLHFEIGEGFLDVTPEGVDVMVDSAERVPISLAPRF